MASRQNRRGGRRTDNDNTAPDGEVIPDVLHDANVPRNENVQAEDHQHQRQQEDDEGIRDETGDIMEEERNVNTELRADDFMAGNTFEADQNIDEAPLPLGEVESNIEEDFERLLFYLATEVGLGGNLMVHVALIIMCYKAIQYCVTIMSMRAVSFRRHRALAPGLIDHEHIINQYQTLSYKARTACCVRIYS